MNAPTPLLAPTVLASSESLNAAERDLFRPTSDASTKKDWVNKHSIFLIHLLHTKMNSTVRYFSVVLCSHKLQFMDVITGSLYCPVTGKCQSSPILSLDLPTIQAVSKEDLKKLLTFKPVLYKGEVLAEAL